MLYRSSFRGRAVLCSGLLAATVVSPVNAQIFYGQPDTSGGETLHRINPDGTGDSAIAARLPKIFTPTWSHDGSTFAVTASDPARPSMLTFNAYILNLATGAFQNVTNFQDTPGANNAYTFTYALYKAFSPNHAQLAVNSYVRSGGGAGNASPTTTPLLQLFPTNGDPGPTATLHVGIFRDEVHHDGEGVDWSPTQNLIAAPFKWDAPLQSGATSTYGPGEATAIYLINPANAASQQLTVPHADLVIGAQIVTWAEHDYAPKFSPNGSQLAYVRSYQQATGAGPDLGVQSLHILNLATRQDRQVIRFQKGLYVSTVDWSPDGTQLVFDLGQQATSSGFPLQAVQPNTDGLYLIGIDGSNPHQLHAPPASTPTWRSVPAALGHLNNISTRVQVGTGNNGLIGGFIVSGTGNKLLLLRALGPTLGSFGVTGALADPTLELHHTDAQGHDSVVTTNDNWTQTQSAAIQATGKAPPRASEAAILANLPPGNYTAILRGKNNTTGVALVEAYDLSPGATSQLSNISSRGLVGTGNNVMIAGFIGGANTKVLVRALGPTLTRFGVPGVLADPVLTLTDANGTTIATNDNWQQSAQASQIQATGKAPPSAPEPAIIALRPSGNTTATVSGKNGATGVALVEVYYLP